MQKILPVLVSLLALTGIFIFNSEQLFNNNISNNNIQLLKKYQAWKSEHGFNFNGSEDDYRFLIFKENNEIIEEHNIKSSTLVLGHTKFGALTLEEYKSTVSLHIRQQNTQQKQDFIKSYSGKNLPSSVDWVSKGAVYPTQNQGKCGSCWAFASIATLESLRFITTGKLELLSVQQIVSCTPAETLDNKKEGCGGGLPEFAFDYTAKNGIELDSSYPYVNGAGGEAKQCEYDATKVVFYNAGKAKVAHNNPEAFQEALVQQPLAVGVDAGNIYFQLYKNGIIDSPSCGTELDHEITAVGYNTNEEVPYWVVQNSWGADWGDNGYAKIKMSKGDGVCGINMDIDFPTDITQAPNYKPNSKISE